MPLKIIRNDITKVDTVAIVNTASRWCEPGAGCDIAIHNAAGYDELLNYRKKHIGAKEEGEAFITPGFKLPAKYIIHVVSPLFIDGTEGEEDKLRACYRNALDLAVDNDISSISFPLIATGSFGYPKADALRVAMDEINAFILNHELDVNIVVFDSTATAMAQKLYPQLEAFIDHNYVCEKREEEYGDPYFGSIRSESDEYDPYKSMFHRLDALVKPGVSSRRKASENEPKDATIPTLGSPVTCGLQNVLADKAEEDYEDAALVEADEDIFDESEYEDELEDSPALKERLLHLQDTFGEYLFYLIDIKGYSSTEVQNRAFHEMAEPNLFINQASMVVRGRGDCWKDEALELINKACNTAWGRKVYAGNPDVARIKELLETSSISHEETVQLISDIEGLHTFSNIISRTRRRDIGEFTVRDPHTVTVDFTPAQRELHDSILQITHEMLSQIHSTDNTKFMMTTIRRQTASCLFGLVPLLKDMLYKHVFELMEEEDFLDSLLEDGKDDSLLMRDRINQIIAMAEKLPKDDPKFDAMMKVVREKQSTQQQKIMIFSSFRHTLSYLYERLLDAGFRVGMIHGGVSDNERLLLRERFDPLLTNPEDKNSIDIMLFSEVGTEGLDYQFCDCMINYDLPWNPMRVEQRIGRIDRTGQKSPKVNIYNLITPDTVDADIYERCLLRVGVFQASVGDCEEILGEITKELKDIASDFEMSDEDRRKKLQQMTDNKVRFIKEQEELEEKQRDLFGIRVSKDAFDKELEEATNFWLSTEMLQNLIVEFLTEILGKDSEYILGEKDIKTLRLSQEARSILLDDLKRHKFKKNEIHRDYEKFLKGAEQFWTITFDVESSKDNKDVHLVSITHPIIKQAAYYLQSKGKHVTKLTVATDKFLPGEFPFAVYQWKLVGDKTDIDIKIVSENESLNDILFELLKESVPAEHVNSIDVSAWERIELIHHDIWEKELCEHKRKTIERIKYKEASLNTSHNARIGALKDQLKNAKNDVSIKLTEGKLNVAVNDYERHLSELHQAKEKADILFELLAYGILRIEPES